MKTKHLLIGCLAALFFIYSCKKETETITNNVITHDTVNIPCPPPLTNAQQLTRVTWKVAETWQHVGGVTTHYLRGVSNNTGNNYDVIRYKFNADGTGTHIDPQGNPYNITWQFTTPDQENLRIVVNGNVVYNYGMVNFTANAFFQTSIFNNSLNSGKWIAE